MLKENACSLPHGRWQLGKLLVVGQLALSLLLLIVAGLFVRSLANLESLDVGYSRVNLVLLNVDLAGSSYGVLQQLPLTRALVDGAFAFVPGHPWGGGLHEWNLLRPGFQNGLIADRWFQPGVKRGFLVQLR